MVGRDVLGAPHRTKGTNQMATKTKAIEVKVDERLALEIADKGANTQTTSADVKPDVDASVVPK